MIVNLLANLAWGCRLAGRGASARPWGVAEPEILRYSNRQFGPIGADAGQCVDLLIKMLNDIPDGEYGAASFDDAEQGKFRC